MAFFIIKSLFRMNESWMNEIDEKQQVFQRQLGGKFTNSFLFIIQFFLFKNMIHACIIGYSRTCISVTNWSKNHPSFNFHIQCRYKIQTKFCFSYVTNERQLNISVGSMHLLVLRTECFIQFVYIYHLMIREVGIQDLNENYPCLRWFNEKNIIS